MRKLILGIISVICLDLAFIIYPGLGHKAERVSPIAKVRTPVIEPASLLNTQSPNLTLDGETATLDLASTKSVPLDPATRRPISKTRADNDDHPRNTGGRSAGVANAFKPVTIEYSRDGALNDASERRNDRANVNKTAARPEDRSFIAAVIPVIRKPYDWVKYLGSKMRRL